MAYDDRRSAARARIDFSRQVRGRPPKTFNPWPIRTQVGEWTRFFEYDTDKDGVMWLSGAARTQEAIDKAISIARETEHVKSVHSDLSIKKDD